MLAAENHKQEECVALGCSLWASHSHQAGHFENWMLMLVGHWSDQTAPLLCSYFADETTVFYNEANNYNVGAGAYSLSQLWSLR